jgi:hypothetical protein
MLASMAILVVGTIAFYGSIRLLEHLTGGKIGTVKRFVQLRNTDFNVEHPKYRRAVLFFFAVVINCPGISLFEIKIRCL